MNKEIKTGESFEVALDSRGAMGLKLQFRAYPQDIVSIEQLESRVGENAQAGDSVKAIFRVKGLNAGSSTITFFETQPWDKEFEPIIVEKVEVNVVA